MSHKQMLNFTQYLDSGHSHHIIRSYSVTLLYKVILILTMGNNILIPITSLNTITKIKNHSLQCEYEDHQHVLDHFQKDFMCKRIAIIFIYLEKYNKI